MSKAAVIMGWADAPHLDEHDKTELLKGIKPHQIDARTKGIPGLGAGAIWPIPESEITCKPFALPQHWPRCYGLDVGWKRTAAIWSAHDRDSDTLYLYSEHYRGQAEPSVHAEAIRRRGQWIPGVIDPSARGRGQRDGQTLMQNYIDLGLDLAPANAAVDAGLDAVFERLSTGRLKVFSTLENFFYEYRMYRRDEKGRVVKENDHLADCTRYLVLSGLAREKVKPVALRARHIATIADRKAGY